MHASVLVHAYKWWDSALIFVQEEEEELQRAVEASIADQQVGVHVKGGSDAYTQ